MRRRRLAGWTGLMLALLLAAGCASRREPIVILDGPDPGGGSALRVASVCLGEQLRWRTADGQSGAGTLLAVEADSLVLVDRHAYTYLTRPAGSAADRQRQVRRIALVDLVELKRWDRQAEPYVSTLIGVPILAAALLLLLFALEPPTCGAN